MRPIDADRVCNNCTFKIPDHDNKCGFQNCLMKTLPVIEAEPVRHGRWVHNDEYVLWAEKYVCSICGRNALSDGDYRHELSNYCPNCGAKMDLEEV